MTALWCSIVIGGCAQLMLRHGVSGGHTQQSARSPYWWLNLLRSPWVWGWGISFVVALVLWLVAISQVNISYAFPLLSAGYVFVAILSRLFLNERVGWRRWLAIGVICVGVMMIARF